MSAKEKLRAVHPITWVALVSIGAAFSWANTHEYRKAPEVYKATLVLVGSSAWSDAGTHHRGWPVSFLSQKRESRHDNTTGTIARRVVQRRSSHIALVTDVGFAVAVLLLAVYAVQSWCVLLAIPRGFRLNVFFAVITWFALGSALMVQTYGRSWNQLLFLGSETIAVVTYLAIGLAIFGLFDLLAAILSRRNRTQPSRGRNAKIENGWRPYPLTWASLAAIGAVLIWANVNEYRRPDLAGDLHNYSHWATYSTGELQRGIPFSYQTHKRVRWVSNRYGRRPADVPEDVELRFSALALLCDVAIAVVVLLLSCYAVQQWCNRLVISRGLNLPLLFAVIGWMFAGPALLVYTLGHDWDYVLRLVPKAILLVVYVSIGLAVYGLFDLLDLTLRRRAKSSSVAP